MMRALAFAAMLLLGGLGMNQAAQAETASTCCQPAAACCAPGAACCAAKKPDSKATQSKTTVQTAQAKPVAPTQGANCCQPAQACCSTGAACCSH